MDAEYLVLDSSFKYSHTIIGYLHSIEKKLNNISKYYVTGSSCIIGLFLCAGMKSNAINSYLLSTTVFDDMVDITEPKLDIMSLNYIFEDMTLKQLKDNTNKTIYFRVYNETDKKFDMISAETHPEMSCLTACKFCYNTPYKFNKFTYCGIHYTDCSFREPIYLPNREILNSKFNPNGLYIYTVIKERDNHPDFEGEDEYYKFLSMKTISVLKDKIMESGNTSIVARLEVEYINENLTYEDKIKQSILGTKYST